MRVFPQSCQYSVNLFGGEMPRKSCSKIMCNGWNAQCEILRGSVGFEKEEQKVLEM